MRYPRGIKIWVIFMRRTSHWVRLGTASIFLPPFCLLMRILFVWSLVDDLPRLLKHFKYHGIIISVCTSDDRASTNACLRNWGIAHLVDYSLSGDEVTYSKPSPQPLLQLCQSAGVSPRDCLVVGDTTSDTGMARASGARAVGVLTGSGKREQLLETGADCVLPNIGHLKDLLLLSKEPSRPVKDLDVQASLHVNTPSIK